MQNLNRISTELFLNDAAVAHTLLDVADTTCESAQRRRYIECAREALNTIDRCLDTLELGSAQVELVERVRGRLWMRLAIVEHRLPFGPHTHRSSPGRTLRTVKGRLQVRRVDDTTVIGFMRDDEHVSVVQIADDSDVETVAGQLRVLAEAIARTPLNSTNPHRRQFSPR